MWPRGMPGRADERNRLALSDRLPDTDKDRRRVCIGGRETVPVLDNDEIAIAPQPACVDHGPDSRSTIWRSIRTPDVDPLVHAPPAHAEAAHDDAVARPDEARGRRETAASRAGVLLRSPDLLAQCGGLPRQPL